MDILRPILNPWLWYLGAPPEGWRHGLETYWPVLVEGALVSVALGLIGCFLVVRGMSLLGDALSHSVLPGIVIGFLIGGVPHSPGVLIGVTPVGAGGAAPVPAGQRQSRSKKDAAPG